MPTFAATFLVVLVSLLALFSVFPTLAGLPARLVFRAFGRHIQRKGKGRRDLIRARVQVEEEDYRSRNLRQSKLDDDDWEKVEGSDSRASSRGSAVESDWDGFVGFFHPFCNAGGGGERVLWAAVRATQKRWPKAICVVYTGDQDVDKTTMLNNIERRFNIQIHPPTIVFCYLSTRQYVLSNTYPRFTLLGQSLGSLVLAYDAFSLLVPDIFVDTMGYAFALAFSRLLFPSVPTGAYVHYPTISTDMLASLEDSTGQKGLNAGAGTGWKGATKRHYWHAFAKLYGLVGGTIDIVMCNSSWTSGHINALWLPARQRKTFKNPTTIFPPVAVSDLEGIQIDSKSERDVRQPTILYIAQFRPEKNHALILRSYARFLKQFRINRSSTSGALNDAPLASSSLTEPKLILIGSVRHSSPDETHIYNLRLLTHELKIRDNTQFILDASWPTVLEHLRTSSIGTNAMWNEHFGIGIVEYQAAGLISVVHDSGGPKMDIVVDLEDGGTTGFRATTEEEYAAAFEAALALPEEEKVAMRKRARTSAQRFTEEEFGRKWVDEMEKLVEIQRKKARRWS
ncbi:asparagine-linked glycosylation protein [Ophidiomyces ophidiicola]|uniref:asparagine-linked glycosylation protein n=1 Tax=Ophidiomyces ophidiicola TaxID=1387563 RepID=UPI0020C330D3|nr:asparagine-linked glycosylation protein [Ophidiomyces ophidiicola]KAI1948012.1 asparagine-linked glycosylation protein [Ophidiomyces ophidiicola]KAI1949708.1 asparagine-linked glycosylation protein [Ophidiomyces ophidiicola]KAI1961630.1 asparagine-linked glycosylation protein [Ophidiomyces ophidiicola]KAI1974218.1 asparagine-linked glycosylation protein [Ophidiomyces ophidiicola]KAI1978768.1 asparagine-linked glycosylation protein [Ophidiomyces ophidiicola]